MRTYFHPLCKKPFPICHILSNTPELPRYTTGLFWRLISSGRFNSQKLSFWYQKHWKIFPVTFNPKDSTFIWSRQTLHNVPREQALILCILISLDTYCVWCVSEKKTIPYYALNNILLLVQVRQHISEHAVDSLSVPREISVRYSSYKPCSCVSASTQLPLQFSINSTHFLLLRKRLWEERQEDLCSLKYVLPPEFWPGQS